MKGQQEVIAIILIVMIVISLAAFAYTWFSGMFSQLMSAAGIFATRTAGRMVTQFKIENIAYDASNGIIYAVIRNIGTRSFNAIQTNFYIDDNPTSYSAFDCPGCDCNNLAQGCIAKYTLTGLGSSLSGSKIRVVIETGMEDSRIIFPMT